MSALPRSYITASPPAAASFFSADGYIVTNAHVISGAGSVQVTTSEGAIYSSEVMALMKERPGRP